MRKEQRFRRLGKPQIEGTIRGVRADCREPFCEAQRFAGDLVSGATAMSDHTFDLEPGLCRVAFFEKNGQLETDFADEVIVL